MVISIASSDNCSYAAKELGFFLKKYTSADIVPKSSSADRSIELSVDKAMPAHHYSISGDGKHLKIVGGNPSSNLCGVYEALSDAGILFRASEYSVPFFFDVNALFSVNKYVKPKFRLRGIRQHINFPMDISSYTLKDAKEYIRSLARMRFNAITFHSYSGQWHETDSKGKKDNAGHFFYGKTYPVSKLDTITAEKINNRTYYCIPEAETLYKNNEAKGEFAIYWLNELMKTAKEAELTITFSVEIAFDGDEAITEMLRGICERYPLIDTLELISEECGGFREMPELNIDNIASFLAKTFDENVLDARGIIPGISDFVPHQLGATAISVRRILRALELRENWLEGLDKKPELRAGIYATCPDTLRVLRPILRARLPKEITLSLLPAHGAVAVADNVASTGTIDSDWQNTMFYSWAEFDGNMFIQQMSTDGIEQLVSMAKDESVYGMCINHWRTAENSLTISYAAEALISAEKTDDFYSKYAKKIGIPTVSAFVDVCNKLASLDTYNRDNLFNIGFCAVGCWLNWCRRGNAIIPRGFPADVQTRSIEEYTGIIRDLQRILPSAIKEEGIAFIRLLINRCQASILHIRSLLTLDGIFDIYDYTDPKPLSEEHAGRIKSIISSAQKYAYDYLHLYSEILPDRGGEGQLVSYYDTTVVFISAVAEHFNGDRITIDGDYDAPPMPDAEVI